LTWYQSEALKREKGHPLETQAAADWWYIIFVIVDFCFCSGQVTMLNTLKIEDKLEGKTNFQAWKARVLLLLEENDLKEYVETMVPSPNDPQELVAHRKKEVKAK
jgi:hypothetical protein